MAIAFNSSGDGGHDPLTPVNGGCAGRLADTGNVCNVLVGPLGVKQVTYSGPGTDYEVRQILGRRPRRVVWDWRAKAIGETEIHEVEALIDEYIVDGRPYTLEVPGGRTTSLAVLLGPESGSRLVMPPRRTPTGAWIARWHLVFAVLRAAYGSNAI